MGKERMLITGGHALEGQVKVSGGKNTAVAVIPATLLSDEPCTIENLPDIEDVHALADILTELGAKVDYEPGKCMRVDPRPAEGTEISYRNAQRLRASYYLLGALLGRCGRAKVPTPGGCEIGSRPVDQHLKGFRSIGADAGEIAGILTAEGTLTGGDVFFDMVTVGGTVNVMLAAVKAKGQTYIYNAAKEPHIVDVANFLNAMGANIKGAGTDTIRIQGVPVLPGGYSYSVIPDQIEAGTYMIAAAVTRGDVTIHNLIPKHMEPLTVKMLEMGFNIDQGDDWIRVSIDDDTELEPANFKTRPYPGFPTDLQPQATVLLCQAHGMSQMHENVWDNRFQYVPELQSMGASISVMERIALVHGPVKFSGARVTALDLRAGAAMVLAGLAAEGTTTIGFANRIERGYEKIVEKLRGIGAEIEHIEEDEEHVLPVDDE